MALPEPLTPGEFDPLRMSPGEKLACEWEARHDVAARGRLGVSAPVQHYLSHLRCEEAQRESRAAAQRHAAHADADAAERYARAAALRSMLRWGEDGPPRSAH